MNLALLMLQADQNSRRRDIVNVIEPLISILWIPRSGPRDGHFNSNMSEVGGNGKRSETGLQQWPLLQLTVVAETLSVKTVPAQTRRY